MTKLNYTVQFKKTVLASVIGLCLSQSCFALQELSDEKLSDTTGEGIALLPQDAYMVFRGAGPNETENNILTNRTLDTGYIHYLPVGPLTANAQDTNKDGLVNSSDHSVGKADLYLYGLALSKNANNDSNSRLDATNQKIKSWGTATNPWVLNVKTDLNVPNFGTATSGSTASKSQDLTYLNFEAPLLDIAKPTDPVKGADAYNLKLGLWADAFVRDQNKKENDPDQFNLGELYNTTAAGRANRIRLQGVWNGFGLNGSRIQMFQTLAGADNNNGMSKFYNNTLGMAGVLRFNSGDSAGLLGVDTQGTATKEQFTTNRYSTIYLGQTNATNTHISQSVAAQYRLRSIDTVYTNSAASWIAPTGLNDHVLRLSTQETTDSSLLTTPALNNSTAPVFNANEGIFIYNLNTNLVLGSLYQPLILGSDGKNFSLEIARIPNKADVYQRIYTDYDNPNSTTYLGSTCNVYQCGNNGITGYQGNSATHSSISIGTVYSPDGGKTLLANSSAGAVGVSFGQLKSNTIAAGSQQIYYQLQMQQRRRGTNGNWEYLDGAGNVVQTVSGTCSGANTSANGCYKFNNSNVPWINVGSFNQPCIANTSVVGSGCTGNANTSTNINIKNSAGTLVDLGYMPGVQHSGYTVGQGWGKFGWNPCSGVADTGYCSSTSISAGDQWTVPTWGGGALGANSAQSVLNAYGAVTNGTEWKSTYDPTPNVAVGTKVISAQPMNNLGSAVIDGLLIQHMKITTKGL